MQTPPPLQPPPPQQYSSRRFSPPSLAEEASMTALQSDDEVEVTDFTIQPARQSVKQEVSVVDPRSIYYLQETCSDTFTRCGRFLACTTQELKDGSRDPMVNDRWILRVVSVNYRMRRGPKAPYQRVLFTRDHRRLRSLQDAGHTQVQGAQQRSPGLGARWWS